MADETVAMTETVEQVEQPAQVAEDKFDEARAMELIKKLRAEVKELSPKAKKAAELEAADAKRKEAELSEADKLSKKLAEAESRLKHMEHVENQRAAAEKVGLPMTFAKRLQGETPEELEADAKEILESLPKAEKKAPGLSPTNPSGAQQGETRAQKLARIHGQDVDPFDPAQARKLGGGVFFTQKD